MPNYQNMDLVALFSFLVYLKRFKGFYDDNVNVFIVIHLLRVYILAHFILFFLELSEVQFINSKW